MRWVVTNKALLHTLWDPDSCATVHCVEILASMWTMQAEMAAKAATEEAASLRARLVAAGTQAAAAEQEADDARADTHRLEGELALVRQERQLPLLPEVTTVPGRVKGSSRQPAQPPLLSTVGGCA